MATIKKYTDENGVNANAILSNGEQQSTNYSTPPATYSFVEFILALCTGTWQGGNVQGFTQYVPADMFTFLTETSEAYVFGPKGSGFLNNISDLSFLSVPDPSTVSDSDRILLQYFGSEGSAVGGDTYMNMALFEKVSRKDIVININEESMRMRIEGYMVIFADVLAISLKVVSISYLPIAPNNPIKAYITLDADSLNPQTISVGTIPFDYNLDECPIYFNLCHNISFNSNNVNAMSFVNATFELRNTDRVLVGPVVL